MDPRKGLGTERSLKCKLGENGQLGPPEGRVA